MNNIKVNFSIKDLENLTGIKAHTIRIWEKRYNLLSPNRSDTNIRNYNLTSFQKLLNISYLNNNGIKISKIADLKEEEIQAVISSLVRKGKEAAVEFRKGNREDLALKEENELNILYEYLPEQLDHSEIEKVLKKIISEESASGPKDMGKVMKAAMARMAGKAGGKEVSEIARKLLSQPE